MALGSPEIPLEDVSPEARVRISDRIAERCLGLMLREFERAPVPVLCADAFIAYQAYLIVGPTWPWAWYVIGVLVQLYRYLLARNMRKRPPASAQDALDGLTKVFAAIGILKTSILPAFFLPSVHTSDGPLLVTMVITGLAAGGVASAAGRVRALVAWGAPLFGVLACGWLFRGGLSGYAIAVLLGLLFAILTAFVRDQGQMIEELVRLVDVREQLSKSLEQARDRAELASEAKTRFFAAASHDLRQPLHALAINATTLNVLAKRSEDEMLRDVSRGIAGALSQSQALLDALLDISKLDAHAVEARKEAVDVGALLKATVDEYEALAARKGVGLTLELPASPAWAFTDADHFNRIVGNLVNNALKFTKLGSVHLRADHFGDSVLVEIRDTGQGVAPGEMDKIFEEFYQAGNPSRDRAQGLGLGLAIVKRTCELLDVELDFSSTVGKGTQVRLFIDASVAPAGLPAAGIADEVPAQAAGGRRSVLVIDDEPQVRESVQRHLTVLGWSVRSGSGGLEGQAAIDSGFRPDVLIVDYRLRGENGLDVIARLRTRMPHLPAIIVTGDTAPQRLRELRSQAHEVLHKPLDGALLERALARAIAMSPLAGGA